LLLGIEPNLRWQTFTDMIAELARELGVEMMITLGSLLADVPHTRPSPVTGGATMRVTPATTMARSPATLWSGYGLSLS